ncbi:MAG: DNA (cytosine-5-)-methyltransferase [Bifidobacteriaceae bacterium]|jgi:DNA (cytosine-5)-methyltransferase 1|nr:DNA (cytosine-5-)-methyltransferase [Bifidobacteriaceae bacterium]
MNYIELFAGIGGFRAALEPLGHKCLAYCEIDKYARQSYQAIFNTTGEQEHHDITKISKQQWLELEPKTDLVVGGFPCQSFSLAGKRKGLDDTRGTLFYDMARCIKYTRPKYFIAENVRGLLSDDKGKTFEIILETFCELGYAVDFDILNTKNYLPQNRERIYIIGQKIETIPKERIINYESDRQSQGVLFGEPENNDVRSTDARANLQKYDEIKRFIGATSGQKILSEPETERQSSSRVIGTYDKNGKVRQSRAIYDKNKIAPTIQSAAGTSGGNVPAIVDKLDKLKDGSQAERVYNADGISQTLAANAGGGGGKTGLYAIRTDYSRNIKRQSSDNVPALRSSSGYRDTNYIVKPVLTAQDRHEVLQNSEIRRLTPKECWRLQGFTDSQFEKAKTSGVSETQLYKQAGNAVSVPVVADVVRGLSE